MNQDKAIELIDNHKNSKTMVHPIELLNWTWLRVIINSISPDEWEELVSRANETMSK